MDISQTNRIKTTELVNCFLKKIAALIYRGFFPIVRLMVGGQVPRYPKAQQNQHCHLRESEIPHSDYFTPWYLRIVG